MQIVCISRGSQSRGAEFAVKLAAKLGFECISREQILEEASRRGIPIGKIETAIIKPYISSERLALDLEHYKALATSIICEKALNNNIVYHGRTGHLLLTGIDHVLKLRVVADMEHRIETVMRDLNLPRKKAVQYIELVDDDRRKWVRKFYNSDWDVFTLYDFIINLSQMNTDNATSAVCRFAELPEFQPTPASVKALKNLYLASKARLELAGDERTDDLNVKVRANQGVVYVTYPFSQADKAQLITEVLKPLKDIKEIVCTQAQTSLVWIQEKFDIDDASYQKVLSLANMWNAAVELIKVSREAPSDAAAVTSEKNNKPKVSWRETGGIDSEEEVTETVPEDISAIYEKLINDGKAVGKQVVPYSERTLLGVLGEQKRYRLIILNNVFLDKGEAARKRLQQEWTNMIFNTTKTPVMTLAELEAQYHFGRRQFTRMLLNAAITALLIFLIFHFDREIISFLSQEGLKWRVISTVCIVLFVPLFAVFYSTVTGLFLKLIKLD
jgi:cytidylate kinase